MRGVMAKTTGTRKKAAGAARRGRLTRQDAVRLNAPTRVGFVKSLYNSYIRLKVYMHCSYTPQNACICTMHEPGSSCT